jgi:hypothetical protein
MILQPNVKLLIDGEFIDSKASKWVDVINPVGLPHFLRFASTPWDPGLTYSHTWATGNSGRRLEAAPDHASGV